MNIDSGKTVSIDNIVYQQTKVVRVDEQTLKNKRVIAALEDDPRADIFKILRTKVLQRLKLDNACVLAITSPQASVGKTLVAVNLAVSIARDSNYSVILVDLDLRCPSIQEYFGLSTTSGLHDYCLNNTPIPELLINPGIKSLVLLPAGKPTRKSSELLSTPKMMNFVAELKSRYPNRIVIVDLPPILPIDDALVIMPAVDACILVTAEGQSSKEDIERSILLIDKNKYIGTVLNKSAEPQINNYYY